MYIDVNVSYGNWPFQVFPVKEMADLKEHLDAHDIGRALVSHLGAVFNPNVNHFNEVLFEQAGRHSTIVPVPVINPAIPGWEKDLQSYRDNYNPKAVKLLPSYHLYSLQSTEVTSLANQLSEWNLPLLVQIRLEDERSQYRGLNIRGLDMKELIAFHKTFPDLKLICLNAYFSEALQIGENTNANVALDISFTESGNTVDALTEHIPPSRLFMGSHTPFLYTLSSTMKIKYSTREQDVQNLIAHGNAQIWFDL